MICLQNFKGTKNINRDLWKKLNFKHNFVSNENSSVFIFCAALFATEYKKRFAPQIKIDLIFLSAQKYQWWLLLCRFLSIRRVFPLQVHISVHSGMRGKQISLCHIVSWFIWTLFDSLDYTSGWMTVDSVQVWRMGYFPRVFRSNPSRYGYLCSHKGARLWVSLWRSPARIKNRTVSGRASGVKLFAKLNVRTSENWLRLKKSFGLDRVLNILFVCFQTAVKWTLLHTCTQNHVTEDRFTYWPGFTGAGKRNYR